MDLIAALYTFFILLVGLFLAGAVTEILLWWYSGSTPKAKARRDWEF